MNFIFTLCSNNYLAQAGILAKSVQLHQGEWKFVIGLTDQPVGEIDYRESGAEILPAFRVEAEIEQLARRYSIVELNTCIKPAFFLYFFETCKADKVIYLDPDICLYGPMHEVDAGLDTNDFVLTPHILSPIPQDIHRPDESLFLNYGLYNLGFLGLKNSEQTLIFLSWWKERTYQKGYDNPALGLFTDQLWINLVPLFFKKVFILENPGYNMAPWNLHERSLTPAGNGWLVNASFPLVFYHFSGFDPLYEKFHRDYTRFSWSQRPDLQPLYQEYRNELVKRKYYEVRNITSPYAMLRQQYLDEEKSKVRERETRLRKVSPFYMKIARTLKKKIPAGIKNFTLKLIQS